MIAKLRSWRQQIKTHPVITVLISLVIALIVLVLLGGYKFNWAWTGFNGANESYKTLYDWLQLLFIPVALAALGFWLNNRERNASERRADKERKEAERHAEYEQKAAERRAEADREIEQKRAETERGIEEDAQCEAALQAYINEISELLLYENLRKSKEEDEVRTIARVRTLTVLRRLDNKRKGIVLQFLHESGLIDKDTSIIDLEGADLSKTNLSHANLKGADLRGAILRGATLGGANLSEANLSKTDLWGADFNGALGGFIDLSTIGGAKTLVYDSYDSGFEANLRGANLSEAILYGSNATTVQLAQAKSLIGATMPDGKIYP